MNLVLALLERDFPVGKHVSIVFIYIYSDAVNIFFHCPCNIVFITRYIFVIGVYLLHIVPGIKQFGPVYGTWM